MSYFICRQAKAWKILQASLANYKLDIKVNDKGVPISAKYNKKDDLISSGDILYKK